MAVCYDWIGVDFLIRETEFPRDKSKIQEYKQNVQERVRSWEGGKVNE